MWPAAAAHDLAVVALQCTLAEAGGSVPPPGMTNIAGGFNGLLGGFRSVEVNFRFR